MSTFSYAYGPELSAQMKARNLYRVIEREIENLDPDARAILNKILTKEFAPSDNERTMAARAALLGQSQFRQSHLQAAAAQQSLSSIFGIGARF